MKNKIITFAGTLITFLFSVTAAALAAPAASTATLGNADCIKCHEKEPAAIERNGGLHKTAVGCIDCHVEHPPLGTDAIPPCSMCHTGKSHYELEACLSCHSDPHEPLALEIKGEVTQPCLTCHPQQGKELQSEPSKHTDLSCTFCHATHKEIPDCSQCHEPHAQGQTIADCLGCHPVHHPLSIRYPNETPRTFCTPCHEQVGELMSKTTTKHQTFTCAFCHRGEHPVVPQCETCHGQPHSPSQHKMMPNCLDCHLDAHNLAK
jgi:hypothetical protein